MTDVARIWYWLEGRGTAPARSIRDFCRRSRWAENAEQQGGTTPDGGQRRLLPRQNAMGEPTMKLEHAIIKTLWRRKAEDGKPAGEALLVFDFDGGGYVLEGHDGGQRRIPSAEFEASWEPWSPEANAKCPTCGREMP